MCMKSVVGDLRGDLTVVFSAAFYEIQIAAKFPQHQFYGNSASSTIKNVFEQIFHVFLIYFVLLFPIICYIAADMKLWSSSCAVFHSITFPINRMSLCKTF